MSDEDTATRTCEARQNGGVDLTPIIGSDPLNLVLSISTIIHHADSEAVRRAVMSAIGFPVDDVSMFLVVNHLAYRGAMRPSEVAVMLGTGRANVTRVARALIDLGLVIRVPSTDDARSVLLTLTPQGRDYARRIIEQNEEFLKRLLSDWSVEEVDSLKRMMARLARQWTSAMADTGNHAALARQWQL
ncbi:MarR family winged helix-turn-helix transcriptional regulator [Arthrobacter sp. D2-10]